MMVLLGGNHMVHMHRKAKQLPRLKSDFQYTCVNIRASTEMLV